MWKASFFFFLKLSTEISLNQVYEVTKEQFKMKIIRIL